MNLAIGLFLALFVASVPIAALLGILAFVFATAFSPLPLIRALGQVSWDTGNDFLLVAVPLYILMGEILLRSGIAARTYEGLANWLTWLPGGLMHSNIGVSALFAATCGSSVATAATVGTVALPQRERYGYNERLFLGSIAAGGTLGILIPPSINLILYGFITETSVPKLYLAAMVPGIALALLFALTIAIACAIRPRWGGTTRSVDWRTRITSLRYLLPPLFLFLLVVGSIYAGLATPTESAALGVIGALFLAILYRTLSLAVLAAAIENTMRVTGMAMLIVVASFFLNFVLSTLGVSQALVAYITQLHLPPILLMIALIVVYLALGCVMDPMAMMVTTVPVVGPLVASLGYDLVWFGILMVVLSETAMIHPPFGINLFVVQTVRHQGSLNDVIIGAAPFILTLLAMIALLLAWPDIALWLPAHVKGSF
ncbi:MAG TPA: TRAP transporter large permease [Hyphomicrobiales bacterium]|nr:TRAP transporter large permease [Hyphomicrobiales bacterium]